MFKLKDATMIYDMDKEEKAYAMNRINLTFPDKGLVGIIGPSGSGKSTMMYTMSTLKRLTEGDILYNGESLSGISEKRRQELRRYEFGFVFQRHYLVSYMTALENAILAASCPVNEAKAKAEKILVDIGLKKSEFNKTPAQLSGGLRQRVAIARAMMNDPKVLFADEPTAELDSAMAAKVTETFQMMSKKEGITILMTTHDVGLMGAADFLIELENGERINAGEEKES